MRMSVDEDERRLALQQLDPIALTRRAEGLIELAEDLGLAELLRDVPPDAVVGPLAAAEGDDLDRAQRLDVVEPAHDGVAQLRRSGEQAEGEQVVRLAAAHRLAEQEGAVGLRVAAVHAGEDLRQECLHARGDEVLREKRAGLEGCKVFEIMNGIACTGVKD